jgi:hypothetical protein
MDASNLFIIFYYNKIFNIKILRHLVYQKCHPYELKTAVQTSYFRFMLFWHHYCAKICANSYEQSYYCLLCVFIIKCYV